MSLSVSARSNSLAQYLESQRALVDESLEALFSSDHGQPIVEAALYSLMLPSKRIRPIFALETCTALCGRFDRALPAALALELVHTYSLVHDDLPSMDNDDLRRGKPTSHKVYGEARAILVGDGLQTKAFEVLSTWGEVPDSVRVAWVRELSRAAGFQGMVGGQDLDIEHLKTSPDQGGLEQLHLLKTAALLAASLAMGAQAAQAEEQVVNEFRSFGLDLGLAFQIQDDVLDVIGGAGLGKPLNSDEKNNKTTYVSLMGLDQARAEAQRILDRALQRLGALNCEHPHVLEGLARYVVDRKF